MSYIYRFRNNVNNPQATTRPTVQQKKGLKTGTTVTENINVTRSLSRIARGNRILNQINTDVGVNQAWIIAETVGLAIDEFILPNVLNSLVKNTQQQLDNGFLPNRAKVVEKLQRRKIAQKITPIATAIGLELFVAYSQKQREIMNINRQTEYLNQINGAIINRR